MEKIQFTFNCPYFSTLYILHIASGKLSDLLKVMEPERETARSPAESPQASIHPLHHWFSNTFKVKDSKYPTI
jgi:hypothetical protein